MLAVAVALCVSSIYLNLSLLYSGVLNLSIDFSKFLNFFRYTIELFFKLVYNKVVIQGERK